MSILTKTRRRRPQSDELRLPRADIFRCTGLRADFGLLTDDEAVSLRALAIEARHLAATREVEGCDPSQLAAQDRRTFEQLVEKASQSPGFFAAERAKIKGEREQRQKARKPSKQQRWEAAGTIVLPPAILLGLQERRLRAVHLLILTVVIGAIENRCAVHSWMSYEDDGSIVLDAVESIVRPLDEDGDISHVGRAVGELQAAGLLVIERHGFVRVRLGALLTDALAERR